MSDSTQNELMQIHLSTIFTQDSDGCLGFINEPWGQTKLAPKLYLGHTLGGQTTYKFRGDIIEEVREEVINLCKVEPVFANASVMHDRMQKYLELLHSGRYETELCFFVPELKFVESDCIAVFESNIGALELGELDWLKDEVAHAQPCVAIVIDGCVASVCRSVRKTPYSHEAGVETAKKFRGNNFAAKVLASWAVAVRDNGALPLFSTSDENAASLRVAQKESMYQYGIGVSVL